MLKHDLIKLVATKTGKTAKEVELITDTYIEVLTNVIIEDGHHKISDFGTFTVKTRAERNCKSPATGEIITCPAHKTVTFTPFASLKQRVNK